MVYPHHPSPSKPKSKSVPPRRRPMIFPHQSPPPAPPMPPGAFSGVPDPMAGGSIPLPRTGDDILNAMLQSWYVCGYYTGYYQRDSKDPK
ncbi:survival motor neuron protein 1-like [Homalodisca vitripennis]|uniref:survival motor neuron protein 1-like n=1 Tax=Homalodisca vitripennis TaxID=197043 RepID=UPI001EEAE6F4|nr:survival motor neuron protein 1-like [Homalodisca vitripennis]